MVLRTEQLTSLATDLGNAILATVPLGGSQTLSSVKDGRGLLAVIDNDWACWDHVGDQLINLSTRIYVPN